MSMRFQIYLNICHEIWAKLYEQFWQRHYGISKLQLTEPFIIIKWLLKFMIRKIGHVY